MPGTTGGGISIGTTPTFPTGGGGVPIPGLGGGGGGGGTLNTIATIAGLGIGVTGLISALRQAGFNRRQIQEAVANYQRLQQMIMPFAQQLLNFGVNPASFLRSPQGQAMLKPLQETTAKNFEGARASLISSQAGSGFSPSSGQTQGPLAALLGDEARAQTDNVSSLVAQSQNLGMQGANILQGQQGGLLPFANSFANLPNTGFQIAGAGGQFLNTLLQLQALNRVLGINSGGN